MTARSPQRVRQLPPRPRTPVVPSAVLAMLIFVAVEVMLFSGFVSAFTIMRGSAVIWPPPGQPRLPIEETAFNTLLLLASGAVLWLAHSASGAPRRARARRCSSRSCSAAPSSRCRAASG